MSQVTIARGTPPEHRRSATSIRRAGGRTSSIEQGAMAEALMLEGKRCVGVRYSVDGVQREARASREVIVSGGSINSPKLLELSGIGQPDLLRSLGITPVHELRGVGENLRDHYSPRVKFAITERNLTFNDNARGWRLRARGDEIRAVRHGFLASTAVPIRMYFRTREGLETPDATISIAAVPLRDGRARAAHRQAAGHHHERQCAALREHRLDPYQIGRSRRAAGDPLQLPVDRA